MAIIQYYARNLNKNTNPIQIIFKKSADFEIPFGYKFADICLVGGGSSGISNMFTAAYLTRIGSDGDHETTGDYSFLQSMGGSGGYVRNFYKQNISEINKIHVEIGDGGIINDNSLMPTINASMNGGTSIPNNIGAGKDTYIKNLITNNEIYKAKGGQGFGSTRWYNLSQETNTRGDWQVFGMPFGLEGKEVETGASINSMDTTNGACSRGFFWGIFYHRTNPRDTSYKFLLISLGGGNLGGNGYYWGKTSSGKIRCDMVGHNGQTEGSLKSGSNYSKNYGIGKYAYYSYGLSGKSSSKIKLNGSIDVDRTEKFKMEVPIGPNEMSGFGPTRVFTDGRWLAGGGGGTDFGGNALNFDIEKKNGISGRYGGLHGGGLCAQVRIQHPSNSKTYNVTEVVEEATDGEPNTGGGGGSGISYMPNINGYTNEAYPYLRNLSVPCLPGKGGSGVCYMRLYPNDMTEGVVFNANNTIIIE